MPADNFHFDMVGVPLSLALEVATLNHQRTVAWSVDSDNKRMVLYWTDCSEATKLPAPVSGKALVSLVESWLSTADYGNEPDHDGDNGKGVHVYNESWGMIDRKYQAFVAISPAWNMYGK